MPCLPSEDPNPEARAAAVASAKLEYPWDHEYLAPLPMLRIDRDGRHPGILEFLAAGLTELPPAERPDDDMPVTRAAATAPGLVRVGIDDLEARFGRLETPADYLALLRDLPEPAHLAGAGSYDLDFATDFAFAWQRLAGPNPVVIERPDPTRWAALAGRLGLTDADLARALGDGAPTVQAALAAGRLLVTDYALLEDPCPIPCGVEDGRQKCLPAPIGVFVWDPARVELRPVAIRLGQVPSAPLRVADGSAAWQAAKCQLSVADFDHHEMATHLALVHFVQEGIAVATRRSLPPQHPVMALLAPHFKYLLLNNFAGRELLVEPGGFVDRILAGQLAGGSLGLVRRAYERFRFDDLDLPRALAARGVVSRTGLPIYPYRDDGLEVWAALDTWVRGYVVAWYPTDEAVATDPELRAWCAEMTAPDGAHLAGFPAGLEDRDRLADTLTRLIFLAGPQHAAVNYAQARSMLVVPNMPGASWSMAPSDPMAMLPPLPAALSQVEAIWLLTCYQYGRLGDYGAAMSEPRVGAPLAALRGHLLDLEARFEERDRTERARKPYPYLRPSRIPNSSNI